MTEFVHKWKAGTRPLTVLVLHGTGGDENDLMPIANAVAPGPVDTPMTEVLHSPEFRSTYTAAVPMKRYGKPSEVADLVSFLASDRAAYITGAVIPVDGGFMGAGV